MAHNPACNMAIDPELNSGYPFAQVGDLYRQGIVEGWSQDTILDKILAVLPPVGKPQADKPLDISFDLTSRSATQLRDHIEQVSTELERHVKAHGLPPRTPEWPIPGAEFRYDPDWDNAGGFAE